MELLLLLLTGHFIADFYLQPAHWVTCKNKHHIKSPGLWKHLAVHALLAMIILIIAGIALLPAIIAILLISLVHFCTNYWQSYRRNSLRYFLIAQSIHIALIGIIWAYLANFTIGQVAAFIANMLNAKNIIIIQRCLAISFIFMGQFAGIGFLVATKTIFRFGDLTNNKDMKLTEYMMLGTLLSYAIALFVGWNALQVYKIL